MRLLRNLLCVGAVMLYSPLSYAEGVGVTAKVGTLGSGLELAKDLGVDFNARLGFGALSHEFSETVEGVDFDVEATLRNAALLLDWHPVRSSFRVTSGLFYNGNSVEAKGISDTAFNLDGVDFQVDEVGELAAEVEFNTVAPYLGIGWGNAPGYIEGFGFSFDVGIVYQGAPDVSLSADGSIVDDPVMGPRFEQARINEEQALGETLKDFRFYPLVSLGLSFTF